MSVLERARQFESDRASDANTGRVANVAADEPPPKPPRPNPRHSSAASEGALLPPSPGLPSPIRSPTPSPKVRPQVPPKSKSLSGVPIVNENRIQLIDLDDDEDDTLQILDPLPLSDEDDSRSDVSALSTGAREGADASQLQLPDRPGVPRSQSESAGGGARNPSPKPFQFIAQGAQSAFKTIKKEVPKGYRTATGFAQNVVNDVNSGISSAVNNARSPKALGKPGQDIFDITKMMLNRTSLCSRCESLPLSSCFTPSSDSSGSGPAYILWSTPLSRVVLHHQWCRMCHLLLSTLCLPENDPMRLADISERVEHDWLRGVPLSKWVEEGYIQQENYWPFGRSSERQEGPTNVIGSFAGNLNAASKQFSFVAFRVLIRAGLGRGANVRLTDFTRPNKTKPTYSQGYRKGVAEGKKLSSKYPVAAMFLMTISTHKADAPGLLWVDFMAASNAPGSEPTVRSHFMLRGVKKGFSISPSPRGPTGYGFALDRNWIDMSVGKLWLTQCETQHGAKCEHPAWATAMAGWQSAMGKPTLLRLIDVEKLSIVVAGKLASHRYVCLSYTWGQVQTLKLRDSNIKELSKEQGLEPYLAKIPLTILHAMQVVKDMGLRYLWVDVLCILQEPDREDSQQQISAMYSVYGSALFTIVAAEGTHADSGLCGIRPGDFSPRGKERNISQQTAKLGEDLSIIAPSNLEQDLQSSPWNTRAWTFQEWLLSRRLFVFGTNQVVFHCRCMIGKEDMSLEESGVRHLSLEWLDLKHEYLFTGADSQRRDGNIETTRHRITHIVRSATFAAYTRMIRQYSMREMTFESDALNALTGLLRIFSVCFDSESIYGLPATLLDVALLWRPIEPLKRRSPSLGFPSWSWVGWKGQVAYDAPATIVRDDFGQEMKIEGIRPVLRYYIFDKQVQALVPLNGTGRGLPELADQCPMDLFSDWELYHNPAQGRISPHPQQVADLYHLDARVGRELSDKHLVFWTSTTASFVLEAMPAQAVDSGWNTIHTASRKGLVNLAGQFVGNVLLDGHEPDEILQDRHEFILLAEAYSSLENDEMRHHNFPYYLIMLTAVNARTGIHSRLGIGRVDKAAWVAAEPLTKLVCLG